VGTDSVCVVCGVCSDALLTKKFRRGTIYGVTARVLNRIEPKRETEYRIPAPYVPYSLVSKLEEVSMWKFRWDEPVGSTV
jgi:hypothetical protein